MENKESSLLRFIKSSGIFFIGSVLSKAISILMLPLYTNRIPTGDMGYYDLSLTYITIATSFLFFDIWVAVLRYMYDGKTEEERATSIKSGLIIFTVSSVMYTVLGVVFAIIFHPDAIYWILIYGLFQNIANFLCFCIRGLSKNKEFAISGIINTVVNVASNLILILVFNIGYKSLYISAIIGFVAQIIYLLIFGRIFKSLKIGTFDKAIIKSMFKYSLPLCINSIAYWILTSLNRVVINAIYGNEMNGIYAVGNKFSFIIGLITTCFTYAWQDVSFSKANEQGIGAFYSNASTMYTKALILSSAVALPALKMVFPLLVGASYNASETTIPLFLIVAAISAISTFIGNIFYAIKETKTIFISMVVSALLNMALCYPLIKYWGINGANLSILFSFIVNIVIRCIVLGKKISFKLGGSLVFLFIPLALSVVSFIYLNWKWNIITFVIMCGVTLLYFKDYIKHFISKLKNRNGEKND